MKRAETGILSELTLSRMHGRAGDFLRASPAGRAAIIASCSREATTPDLAERMLANAIYAQASSRAGVLRELLQNALDASPLGARIDVRSMSPVSPAPPAPGRGGTCLDRAITVVDRGRGMSRADLLEDLLVPFRSAKEGSHNALGEHGQGFLSALAVAPRVEILSATTTEAHRLTLAALGERAPHRDFSWTLTEMRRPDMAGLGTSVRLELERPVAREALAAEVAEVAGLVDPRAARILFNSAQINDALDRTREVARAAIGPGGALGELTLFLGRDGVLARRLLVTQGGLLIEAREAGVGRAPSGSAAGRDPAALAPTNLDLERSVHRELLQALTAAGYGLVAALPRAVPLNKGRSAVAASVARAVEEAIGEAFERFVLLDALRERELLRAVDHRVATVLDRALDSAIAGDPDMPFARVPAEAALTATPTVAAPEGVVRFALAMLDAPLFTASILEPYPLASVEAPRLRERRERRSLRALLEAHHAGTLREAIGALEATGVTETRRDPNGHRAVYLCPTDPLAGALLDRLLMRREGARQRQAAHGPPPRGLTMPCVSRERLVHAAELPEIRALIAAITVVERIDLAISTAAGLRGSAITVHQDLYGPDEMAHTGGASISLNVASARVHALLAAGLAGDPVAFAALVDLILHEKAHVSLAGLAPRAIAEHGASFYRRKDWLRRCLLEAIQAGVIPDPITWCSSLRHGLASITLPSREALARTLSAADDLAA
jgi:Histidine kinase-, DNA gyrase B-, and HSP90-like ATPase